MPETTNTEPSTPSNESRGEPPSTPSRTPSSVDRAIAWFRQATPYIKEHQGKTVVLCVPDRVLSSEAMGTLAHDLMLLSHLGTRLVLSFGVRSEVDARLKTAPLFHDGRRVTDDAALNVVIKAAGNARSELEARLSMGLPNTPMAGAHLSVCSGNLVTARPFGVHDGIDFQHTGTVREIQKQAIHSLLESGHVVLLPPLGYSLTGEVFNLPSEEVAVETAVALNADKLILFSPELPRRDNEAWLRESHADELRSIAATHTNKQLARTFEHACTASERGVTRVHLLPDSNPNALLRELFTVDGAGTLITTERFERLRQAGIHDVGGIIELIEPLQRDGTLIKRSREALELDIARFTVLEREGKVVACAALFISPTDLKAEIACLVTHPDYQGEGRAAKLLKALKKEAVRAGAKTLSIRTTRTAHWFIERGFVAADVDALPDARKAGYSQSRNAKIFSQEL